MPSLLYLWAHLLAHSNLDKWDEEGVALESLRQVN